ncbi:hypothetical protein GF351_00775, partial [Candidatus Woesearchaeota archaeon]|nr:hypothetical protein [Candidatus Woesearchaeota archaeon]
MQLKSIKLENIRSYLNEKIEFPSGSLLLSGDIGSGKSTILLAVEFALFGILRGTLHGDTLLRKGKDQGSVELCFSAEGKQVTVKRILKRGKDDVKQQSGYLIVDGVKQEATAQELKSRILGILGYPRDLLTKSKSLIYRYTVYTPQEEMKQILTESKDVRLNTLRKVFGIDKYKRIQENSQILLKELREKRKEYEGRTADLGQRKEELAARRSEAEQHRKRLEEINPRVNESQSTAARKKQELAAAEERVDNVRKLKSELQMLDQRLNDRADQHSRNSKEDEQLKQEINSLQEQAAKLEVSRSDEEAVEKEIRDAEEKCRKVEKEKSSLKEKIAALTSRIEDTEKELRDNSSARKQLEKKEAELKQLAESLDRKDLMRKSLAEKETRMREVTALLNKAEANKVNAEKIKDDIMRLDRCPTCRQDVSGEHKHKVRDSEGEKIRYLDEEIRSLSDERSALEERISQMKKDLETLAEKEVEQGRLKAEIKALRDTA